VNRQASLPCIDQPRYRQALLDAGQILEWTPPKETWSSREEWNRSKPTHQWLFTAIDHDKDGKISVAEYKEFQAFKATHHDWERQMRERTN
jgi:hypothetical protein